MYRPMKAHSAKLKGIQAEQGESIEAKIRRIMNNNEPIGDGAPLNFTERKDGVVPEYDIRTDRMELAVEATDKITKAALAQREKRMNPAPDPKPNGPDGNVEGATATSAKTD